MYIVFLQKLYTSYKKCVIKLYTMMLDILNKTPGLLFTLMLIAFVIGTMVVSISEANAANAAKPK
jgi:hypothetical protein